MQLLRKRLRLADEAGKKNPPLIFYVPMAIVGAAALVLITKRVVEPDGVLERRKATHLELQQLREFQAKTQREVRSREINARIAAKAQEISAATVATATISHGDHSQNGNGPPAAG